MSLATPDALPTRTDALEQLKVLRDLSMIRAKMANPMQGKGYDDYHLNVMETEYRKFLALHLASTDIDGVLCGIVDEM